MSKHQRVNPFDQGTAERVLFDRYRKATIEADRLEREAAVTMTEAKARRSSADRYAEALRATACLAVAAGGTAGMAVFALAEFVAVRWNPFT